MHAILEALKPETVTGAVFVLALVGAIGCALGNVRVLGIRLGIAGVMFVGIVFGHFHVSIEHHILEFVREFGLILFVYAVGLQVAPGFFSSLRREGLTLNALAALNVLLSVAVILAVVYIGKVELPAAVGIFSGATTNTPSLAASQSALKEVVAEDPEIVAKPALGYAVSYPFGILGIILTMLLIRKVFRVDVAREDHELSRSLCQEVRPVERRNIKIHNPNVVGKTVREVSRSYEGVVFSRLLHDGQVTVIVPDTRLGLDDVVLVVGQRQRLNALEAWLGGESDVDLTTIKGPVQSRPILVTHSSVIGKTIDELEVDTKYGVQITRIRRGDLDFTPGPAVRLQLADAVIAVGKEDGLAAVSRLLGDSPKRLQQTEVIPFFLGIAAGVLLGTLPLPIPGLAASVKLGIAGGPLLVAIVLGRLGKLGPLHWFVPAGASNILRELGIILFLCAVGLKSGESFIQTLLHGDGFYWMVCGAITTLIPLLIVAFLARIMLKMNYLTLCGLLSGAMTDPPALAFAGSITGSETPYVAYATVYPLTMILRILAAQIMVILLL